MISLTVLGGYLGSGKTTLLNQLLARNDGRRLAVIVNDFGSINIDERLLQNFDGDVLSLANGCVCCSISTGFAETLTALARRTPPPEHVIVETSGIANPAKVALYGGLPPYRLDGIVVVADAESVRERSTDRYVGESVLRQLRAADLIVLNKMDLVAPADRLKLLRWLDETVAGAGVIEAAYGRVPLEALLGLHTAHRKESGHRDASHEGYQTWNVASDVPVAEATFRADVAAWPTRVLRAKGFVHLTDDPLQRYLFQLVGRRWSLLPDGEWTGNPRTEIAIIALETQ